MTKARDISKLLSTANGKIAGANLDVSFENISDTGTAGTKVASGTTAERGSTAGQIRFNSDVAVLEFYDGTTHKYIGQNLPPTFITASGSLGTITDAQRGGGYTLTQIEATEPENTSIAFSITSGSIPSGLTFNSLSSSKVVASSTKLVISLSLCFSATIAEVSVLFSKLL